MSQSPDEYVELSPESDYLKSFDALGAMIGRGRSFSGRERNCCFLNTGTDRFSDVSSATGLDFIDDGRVIAPVDWDGDGDLDLWISNRTAPRIRFVRNELKSSNNSLAIKLIGTRCNRDAIGARVEFHLAASNQHKIIKTLRAGEGFLGQSSKWIHVGLGSAESVEQIVVHWPGMKTPESFPAMTAGDRYTIVQGSGEVSRWDRDSGELAIKPSSPAIPPHSGQARIFLTHRQPLPTLRFKTLDRNDQVFHVDPDSNATLINLWSSWCAPCLQELAEIAESRERLNQRGIQLLALSTDRLGAAASVDENATSEFLKSIGWPYQAGFATEQTVEMFTRLNNQIVYPERPLPLPTSFLVDPNGQVAVIYKGPVLMEQLVSDVDLLDAPPDQLAAAAFPFPGKIASRFFPRDRVAVAQAFLEGGYAEDARRELLRFINENREAAQNGTNSGRFRARLSQAFFVLGNIEREIGQLKDAVAAFQQAAQLAPDQPAPLVSLAEALWDHGDRQQVRSLLDRAAQMATDDSHALWMAGRAHQKIGDSGQAISLLRRAVARQPNNTNMRFDLAVAHQAAGQSAEAIAQYRQVLKVQPRAINAANNLAWILATDEDEQLRNTALAVRIARQVSRATGDRRPRILDTLSVAHAANGDFAEAARIAQKAIDLASQMNLADFEQELIEKIKLYRQSKPYLPDGD